MQTTKTQLMNKVKEAKGNLWWNTLWINDLSTYYQGSELLQSPKKHFDLVSLLSPQLVFVFFAVRGTVTETVIHCNESSDVIRFHSAGKLEARGKVRFWQTRKCTNSFSEFPVPHPPSLLGVEGSNMSFYGQVSLKNIILISLFIYYCLQCHDKVALLPHYLSKKLQSPEH